MLAGAKTAPVAGNMCAGQRDDGLDAGARIGCSADHLLHAVPGLDHAEAQLVGIRMLLGLRHMGDGEGIEMRGRADVLDFEAHADETLADLVERRGRVEMILQPGEREFHDSPPASVGTCRARNP